MLYPPGFYFVKKPKRFVILSSDKSSERNLSSFFDIKKPRRMEHLQIEEPFSSDPYFNTTTTLGDGNASHRYSWRVFAILDNFLAIFGLFLPPLLTATTQREGNACHSTGTSTSHEQSC